MATGFLDRVRENWDKKDQWPPPHVKKRWAEIESYRRRYRNNRDEMIRDNPNISTNDHKVSIYVPVPWPRELCRFSAALLFSETPRVQIEGHDDGAILNELMEVNDFGAFAIRGGVKAAAEGRVGIRIIRDSDISATTPLLTIVPEDQIIWDIRHDAFYAGGMVVIERYEHQDTNDEIVFRLLETHTAGLVERDLYRGGKAELGKKVPLSQFPEFASLEPVEHTGLDKPTLIPWENVPGAESDLFGLGPLFDDLNEQESLLLDRVRKAVPRAFVDRSLADETGRLEIDGYILTGGARMRPALGATPGSLVTTVQPPLLSVEAIAAIDHLQQLIVTMAGYAPDTWGIQGKTASVQRAVSGYAMKLAQLRTLLNRAGKEHMALQALGWGVATCLAWQDSTSGAGSVKVSDYLPSIELGDGVPNDPLDGAQEVLYLRQAMSASTETLVKTVHPTWSDGQVAEEVEAILETAGMPPGSGPALGLGNVGSTVRGLMVDDDNPAMRAGAGVDPSVGTD